MFLFQEQIASQHKEMQALASQELNQELLDEKNQEIDELTQQVEEAQRECDSVKAQLALRESEVADLRSEERPLEAAVGQEEEQVQELVWMIVDH